MPRSSREVMSVDLLFLGKAVEDVFDSKLISCSIIARDVRIRHDDSKFGG